jgi:hypothetical protein
LIELKWEKAKENEYTWIEKSKQTRVSFFSGMGAASFYTVYLRQNHIPSERTNHSSKGFPSPAALKVASSGPRPEQQFASFPSMTTAGTDRIPRLLARSDTSGLFISSILTSQDGQAIRLIISTVSLHAGHPALKTSILRFVFIVYTSFLAYFSNADKIGPFPISFRENTFGVLNKQHNGHSKKLL